MKLYVLRGSPNCHKVLATAADIGLDPDIIEMELFGPGMKAEEYLGMNPNGKTPVLVDGDKTLWESNAICVYFAATSDSNLYPAPYRSEILQWMFWESIQYNQQLGEIAWESAVKPRLLNQDTDTAYVKKLSDGFSKYAAVLDKHLEDNEYMVGNDWTIADYAVGALEKFAEIVPVDFGEYPNISGYYARLRDNAYWADTRVALEELAGAA